MNIKAIETIYNGIRFRSRLEARWAIFMDALGVKWEYEPEGFTDGTLCYLPDFWLPNQNCYLEIKPTTPSELEINKACMLSIGTNYPIAIVWGRPSTPLQSLSWDPWQLVRDELGIGRDDMCESFIEEKSYYINHIQNLETGSLGIDPETAKIFSTQGKIMAGYNTHNSYPCGFLPCEFNRCPLCEKFAITQRDFFYSHGINVCAYECSPRIAMCLFKCRRAKDNLDGFWCRPGFDPDARPPFARAFTESVENLILELSKSEMPHWRDYSGHINKSESRSILSHAVFSANNHRFGGR